MTRRQNRRRFLSTTAALAFAGARAYALDASKAGPNAAIQLGLIGCGFRGQQLTGALPRIVAVCDVHEGRMEQTRKRIGAERVIAYHDYRKLLENKDVDAVVITSNDHWHFLHAMHALQAGKDVYVEKPLCTSIHEGRLLVEAARKSRRVVQFGTWQRSMEHYCKAAEIVRSGRLGQVCQVLAWDYDNFYPGFGAPPNADPPKGLDWELYLGPAPQSAYNPNRYNMPHWYFFSDYSAGWQSGWGVHHFDIIHWATGARSPIAASAMGGKLAFPGDNTEHPDTLDGILQYPSCPAAKNGFVLHYTYRCGCRREARSHGKYFLGTHGALLVTRGGYWLTPETHVDRGFPKDGDTIVNALAWLDGSKGRQTKPIAEESQVTRHDSNRHFEIFFENVGNRTLPIAEGVEAGHYATVPGHLLGIAWKVGRQIRWEGDKETIPGDPEANALLTRKYRAPWTLEG